MAKPLPTRSFLCPQCSTQLRVRERRFINREITCPACETNFLISLTEEEEIKISFEAPKPATKIAVPQQSSSLFNLNTACWVVSLILICLIGYAYLGKTDEEPKPTIATSTSEATKEPKQPPKKLTEEPAPSTNAEPIPAPKPEPEPDSPAPQTVTSVKKWEPRNLPPTFAEKPEPDRPPIPQKWVSLMELSINEYRVEGLSRQKMLEELQSMAGTKFEHADQSTTSQISNEPTAVSFVLTETNFAELLEKTLAPVGLTYELLEDKILILPNGNSALPLEETSAETTIQ